MPPVQLLEDIHASPPPATSLHPSSPPDSEIHSLLLQSRRVGGCQHIRRAGCTSKVQSQPWRKQGSLRLASFCVLLGRMPGCYFSIYCSTGSVIWVCSKSLFKRTHSKAFQTMVQISKPFSSLFSNCWK